MQLPLSILGIAVFSMTLPVSAVIVAGASGGGNTSNNTTGAQLNSELSTSFPYGNVVQYSGASGVYLGYDPATSDVWVMTARHIGGSPDPIVIDGVSYDYQSEALPGGDLRLVRYRRADLAVPGLVAVKVSSTMPIANTSLVVVGFGQNRTENAATDSLFSDATLTGGSTVGYHYTGTNIERWGTNNIEAEFPNSFEVGTPVAGPTGTFSMGDYNTVGYTTDFDQPLPGQWLSSNEAQGSNNDSGGGAFYFDGTEWVLSGIYSAVAGFVGQDGGTAAFANISFLTDVASYTSGINTALGGVILVPEPTAPLLLGIAGIGVLARRRRGILV